VITSIRIFLAAAAVLGLVHSSQLGLANESHPIKFMGVNLAGAEFKARRLPGRFGKDYVYPTDDELNYFFEHGFNAFRLPFRWERLQRKLGANLNARELEAIDKVVEYVTQREGTVILDPHNYAKYAKKNIGSEEVPVSAFAAFWKKLADHYKTNERVVFGLMNEPFKPRADVWRRAVDAAVQAIRDTGARNLILVPGTIWSGAHSWQSPRKGISNAEAFRSLRDPADNFAFEVHQYFDGNYSGTTRSCSKGAQAVAAIERMTKWLRDNKHRGFLGEFGVADSTDCLEALDGVLQHISVNGDVWLGWTYWAAGAWWVDYPFSVHPTEDGELQPQMKVLKKYTRVP
jgi:endoglucanase